MAKLPRVSRETRKKVYEQIWAEQATELGEPQTEADQRAFHRYITAMTNSVVMRAKLASMNGKPLELGKDHPI